jgi:hypothetical protein
MGKLLEGFKILCTDFDHILEKNGKVFKGGYYSREDTNQGNTVVVVDNILFDILPTG